jgi:hypothetical protein
MLDTDLKLEPLNEVVQRCLNLFDGSPESRAATAEALVRTLDFRTSDRKATLDAALTSLHALIGTESRLTIPLSTGIVAKVTFTGELTKASMEAFAKIFAHIAAEYFIDDSAARSPNA